MSKSQKCFEPCPKCGANAIDCIFKKTFFYTPEHPVWGCQNCHHRWGNGKKWNEDAIAFFIGKEDYSLYDDGQKIWRLVKGDLLGQPVEVIVNAWNRNIIPWWLLLPQGVSGAIKKRGGYGPFKELGKMGPIPAGGAVVTGPGRLPFKAIIHVAGINMLWRSSEKIIRDCVVNAMRIAKEKGYKSVAFPLIGAGTGGFDEWEAFRIMQESLQGCEFVGEVRIVRFKQS